MFWIISSLLVLLAAAFVLVPLWQGRRGPTETLSVDDRREINLGIFAERRQELDNELSAGNLDQEQHASLLLELQRGLLRDTEEDAAGKGQGSQRIGIAVPVGGVVLMIALAFPLYSHWGFFRDVAPRDLYEQTFANANGDPQIARDLVLQLGEVIRDDPDNAWAMYFLARNLTTLNLYDEALLAFSQAVRLMDDSTDKAAILGQYAQIKYITSQGELTPEVMSLVDQARAINPNEMSVLQLLSIDAELKGDYPTAISYWRLMIQADPGSAQAQALRNSIAQAQQKMGQDDSAASGEGPRIEVHLALAPGLELPADRRVFVTARDAVRENIPPLAVRELTVGDLPATITLDDGAAMAPMFNLSSADSVYITAIVSRSGTANVQSGDYRQVSENFAHNGQDAVIDLVISDAVP